MCSIDAANAPSFFLHHAFIDKIWWDVQQKSKEFYEGIFKNQTENMVASPYRPNQFLNLNHQPGYIHVDYANATVNSATRVTKMIRSKLSSLFIVLLNTFQTSSQKVFTTVKVILHELKSYWDTKVFNSRVSLQFFCRAYCFTLHNAQKMFFLSDPYIVRLGQNPGNFFFSCNILIMGISRSNQVP